MPRRGLALGDIEVLFALIYLLRDTPVQTGRAAAESRAHHGQLWLQQTGAMSNGDATRRKPSGYDSDNLGVQVEALRQALERWFSSGDLPPSLAPTLIQFMLITAKAETYEKAFLAAFCHHFGDEHAERYSVVVERAVELGVYPLPLVADPDGHVATEAALGEPQALFDDFSLEEASSTPVEFIEPEAAAQPALEEATGALDRSSRDEGEAKATRVNESAAVAVSDASHVLASRRQERHKQPDRPLAPDSRLSRKATGNLRPNAPAPARRGFWRLFQGQTR